MPCHHTWFQKGKDVVSTVNGLVTTKYTHECPQCGKIKVTVRASNKLPPEVRWKRELEKLLERAASSGYVYEFNSTPIDSKEIKVYARQTNT